MGQDLSAEKEDHLLLWWVHGEKVHRKTGDYKGAREVYTRCMEIRTAGIQMDIRSRDWEGNLGIAVDRITAAAASGVDLVCLPEMFPTGFDYEYIRERAEPISGPFMTALGETARDAEVHLVCGSFPEREGDEIYNTAVLLGPDGEIIGKYRKIHLFPLMEENLHLSPGGDIPVFETALGRLGLMICYDLRFPELSRALALGGAEVILLPAEFPYPRLDHWRCLLQARAVENQCFIVAVNRVGSAGSTRFFGNSSIYDPWGELVAGTGDDEDVVRGRMDTSLVEEVRRRIPVFADRRGDLY
jgi:predicted amidohydrolase